MIKSIYRRAAELGIPAGVYLTVAMLSIVFGDKLPPCFLWQFCYCLFRL